MVKNIMGDDMSVQNNDFSKIIDLLQYADDNIDILLNGDKLYLDPEDSNDALWIDLIHSFYPDDFEDTYDRNLDSKPQMYYITPHQVANEEENILLSSDTSVHPLHTNLQKSNEVFLRACSASDVNNIVVAGANPHFRDRRNYNALFERSENLFLHEKGDLVSLSQTVKSLLNIVEGRNNSGQSVTIENTTGRFTPFLKIISQYYPQANDWLNDVLEEKGINARIGIVEQKRTSVSKLQAIGYDVEKELPELPALYQNLFFETSSEEKEVDVRRAIAHHRLDVKIRHANELLGHSEHAPEFKWSYGGNDLDKLKLTLKDKLAEPGLDDDLAAMGLTRETAFIMVADGGESLSDERLRRTSMMRDVLSSTHPYSEFPGSETKPVAQRHGSKDDGYYIMEQAFNELGGDADLRFADNCVVMVASLAQDDPENPIYYAFKNKTKMELTFTPKPEFHLHRTQRHFQKPKGYEATVAQLEEDDDIWMHSGLAISGAVANTLKAGGAQQLEVDLKADFNVANNLKVVCPWPIAKDSDTVQKFSEQGINVVGLDNIGIEQPANSFDDVRRIMRRSEAFVFPDMPIGNKENFWMSRVFLPTSIYVAKQLRDPNVNGSPMVLIADNGNNRSEVEQVFDHLKNAAMVTQDPHYIYNRAEKIESAANYIKRESQHSIEYAEIESHPYVQLPDTDSPRGAVTFLLSASSANSCDNDDGYSAAVNFGLNGYDLMSGMGAQNPMGWSVFGGLQLIREGFDVNVQGIQDPFAMKTEGWPIKEMNKFMGQGHAVVSPDILVRLEQLLELEKLKNDPNFLKIVVCQASGIGGLQEISGILALREAGVAGMENVQMIIQNRPRPTKNGEIAPQDALLEIIEAHGDSYNIHICETIEEMMQITSDISGNDMQFYDVKRPQDTLFPFAREKHDYYDWLMSDDSNDHVKKPEHLIREVYNETHAAKLPFDSEPH